MKRLLTLCLTAFSLTASAYSPWLPIPGDKSVALAYSQERFQDFWKGQKHARLADDITLRTLWLAADYGFNDAIAFDLLTGFVRSDYSPATRGHFKGRADSRLGVSVRVLDEDATTADLPTVTLRLAGILEGTYPLSSAGNPHAPGDGVSGFESSLLVGKRLPLFNSESPFALSGEGGFRYRQKPVPNELFFSARVAQTVLQSLIWHAAWQYQRSLSGGDIGVAPFSPTALGFQGLKERVHSAECGASYTFVPGRVLGVAFSWVFDGRNTGKSRIASVVLSQSF